MKIALGADHGGFELKKELVEGLRDLKYVVDDLGRFSSEPFDYPDVAHVAARGIAQGSYERAILVCGTGVGMAIVANRYRGVRAANCADVFSARYSRAHNDANVLTLGRTRRRRRAGVGDRQRVARDAVRRGRPARAPRGEDRPAMRCPFCAHEDSKVIDSRVSTAGDVIRRRRECESCERRFTSRERVEDVLPVVVKKDGVREPFDREKVLRGRAPRVQQATGRDGPHREVHRRARAGPRRERGEGSREPGASASA